MLLQAPAPAPVHSEESFFESMSKDVKAVQLASAPSLLQAAAPSMLLQAPAPAPVHSEESFFESMSKHVKAVQLASAPSLLQAESPSMLLQAPAPAPVHKNSIAGGRGLLAVPQADQV